MSSGITGPETPDRRARKRAQTRAVIAGAAAELFARNGFRAVTMIEIAAVADVSEQTVYNYFPTKESLVFDRIDEVRQSLVDTVGDRRDGNDVADAFRHWLDLAVLGDAARRSRRQPGGMPRLVAADPALRRHLLDHADTMAAALSARLCETGHTDPVLTRTLVDALLQVYLRAVDRLGTVRTTAHLTKLTTDTLRALDALRPALHACVAAPRGRSRPGNRRVDGRTGTP